MLTPRLTNCQDCHKIPDLLKQIDCKLAELSNDAYNDIVFMLGNCIPAYEINQLLAYKRILTFKYCNPHYAGSYSVNDIASKVIRLTAGCVSRCNEPTVCEITTCCVDIVPNPTTTTTSTSSTSTTTTSTSSTSTTTTTIYPDCRVEGCFEELTTTTTTTSPPTTTTTTTAAVTGCSQPFNFNAPEGFPGVNTGNGIKTLSNGTILTMTSPSSDCNPVYIPGPSPQLDPNNWGDETCSLPGVHNNQFNNEGWYTLGSGTCAQTTLQFSESVGALAFYQSGIGYYPNSGVYETVNVTGDVDLSISTIGVCEANPGDWQIINETDGSVTYKGRVFQGESGLVSLFAIYPRNPGDRIGELTFEHIGDRLGGHGLDFYLCPDDQSTTTTTTTVAPTTTTTSTTSSTTTTTTTEFTPSIDERTYVRFASEGGNGCDSGDYPFSGSASSFSPSSQASRITNLSVTWEDIEYVEIVNVISTDSNMTITYNGTTVTSGTQLVPTGSSTWEYDLLMEIDTFTCNDLIEVWETRVKLTGYPISNTAISNISFQTDSTCPSCA
jgi:hypothetical protein